ncbi:MAG: 1-acyl-sn-glycerol-3-phosphate acyltransferase [Firmicutes bacterium]|nr:1-acyl-sn-glycerol-3-phosphate acyltransferase [Bacillota bacterium]
MFDKNICKKINKNCFILMNHQASFDQMMLGAVFNFGINFVADDTFFHQGLKSFLMKIFMRPISYSKGNLDAFAATQIINIINQGGAVGMFPEGTRSMFGEGGRVVPSVGKLAKQLKVPCVLVVQKGGYLTKPRWRKKLSRGKIEIEIVKIISPSELDVMSDSEVQGTIKKALCHNDFEFNKIENIKFKGKKRAEDLESVLFFCPICHSLNSLSSKNDEIWCSQCSMRDIVQENGMFSNEIREKAMPNSILEWSKIQLEFIKNNIDYLFHLETPLFTDCQITFFESKKSKRISKKIFGEIYLYSDRLEICSKIFPLEVIKAFSIDGVNRLNIFLTNDTSYSIICKPKVNLVKYLMVACQIKNNLKGCEHFC